MFDEGTQVQWVDPSGELCQGTILQFGIPSRDPHRPPRLRVDRDGQRVFVQPIDCLLLPASSSAEVGT